MSGAAIRSQVCSAFQAAVDAQVAGWEGELERADVERAVSFAADWLAWATGLPHGSMRQLVRDEARRRVRRRSMAPVR